MVSTTAEDSVAMFLDLCHEHRPYIYNFVKRRVRNEADIEEIVQEVFMRAYESRDDLMTITNCRGWLTGTAKNVIHEFTKTAVKQNIISEKVSLTKPNMDSYNMDYDAYSDVLQELKTDDRKIIVLYGIAGFSVAEIAEMLHIKQNTAAQRLSRARKRFEKAIKRTGQ